MIDCGTTALPNDLVAFMLPIAAISFRTVNLLVVSPTDWPQHETLYLKLLTGLLRSAAYLQTHQQYAMALMKQRHPALTSRGIATALNTATLNGDRDGILALEYVLRKDGVLAMNCKPLTHVNLDPYHQALLKLNTRFPHEEYYSDALLDLGDFSILPDCCK